MHARTLVAVGVLVCLLAGCGSDAGDAPPASTESGSPADAGTSAAVKKAYATFFSSTTSPAQSAATLQHGEKFVATLNKQAAGSYAKDSSGSVGSVRLISPDLAAVTFTITSGGSALLSDIPGYAVRTEGRWQVAADTFCGLLRLEGDAPAACDDAAVTALPS